MKDEVFGDLTRIDGGGWMLGKDPREFLAEQGIDPADPDYKTKMMNVDVSDLMRGMVGDAAFGEVEKMLGGAGSRGGPGKKGKAAETSGGTGGPAPRAVPDLRSADKMFAYATIQVEDRPGKGPSEGQRQAYRLLGGNAAAVAESIAAAMFDAIGKLLDERPDLADVLKRPKSAAALRKKLQVRDVQVERKLDDGVAFVKLTVTHYTDEPDSSVEVTLRGDQIVEIDELREAKRGRHSIDHPLLGKLVLDEQYGWWTGEVRLPFFADFHGEGARPAGKDKPRRGPVDEDEARRAQGRFEITAKGDEGETGEAQAAAGLSRAQEAAARRLVEKQESVGRAIAAALLKDYNERYNDHLEWVRDKKRVPKLDSPEGVKQVVALSGLTLHRQEKKGVAYVGFSFHCTWDDEHGCGVLTHDGKVVAVGESDTAFDELIIDYVQEEQKGQWD